MKIPQSVFADEDSKWTQAVADANGDVYLFACGTKIEPKATGWGPIDGATPRRQLSKWCGVNAFRAGWLTTTPASPDWWRDAWTLREVAPGVPYCPPPTPQPEAPIGPMLVGMPAPVIKTTTVFNVELHSVDVENLLCCAIENEYPQLKDNKWRKHTVLPLTGAAIRIDVELKS